MITIALAFTGAAVFLVPAATGAATCTTGDIVCLGACVNPATDPNNCGNCGNKCAGGGSCVSGSCVVPTCTTGDIMCPKGCVNPATDPNNCGNCGNKCAGGGSCVSGVCVVPTCTTGDIECPSGCVKPVTDVNNCGNCGNKCPVGAGCVSGVCVAATVTPTPLVRRAGHLSIVDAKGKFVATSGMGSILTDAPLSVVLRVKGLPLLFAVNTSGFIPSPQPVYFESSDCSGRALTTPPTSDLLQNAQVVPEGTALYVYLPQPNAESQIYTVGSFLNANGSGCAPTTCSPTCPSVSAVPATKVIDLNTEFTPPFSIR